MGKAPARRPSILIVHPDPGWTDRAKDLLEQAGCDVVACLEPGWAADLLDGSNFFDLAAVSSETDPMTQAQILKAVGRRTVPPKILLLLDALDSASVLIRRGGLLTHRLTPDAGEFVKTVLSHVRAPRPPK